MGSEPRFSAKVLPAGLRQLAIALPIVFVCHVLEEAPHFVEWFNNLVTPGISQRLFLTVNLTAFVITILLGGLVATTREAVLSIITVAWVGFLMLANGIFHLVATLVHWRYSPGVITGTLLYIPVSFLFMRAAVRQCAYTWPTVMSVALFDGIPMYLHGFMIVFRGSRLS
jgi:hypothetical protein